MICFSSSHRSSKKRLNSINKSAWNTHWSLFATRTKA